MCVYIYVYIYVYVYISVYLYLFIHIQQEREVIRRELWQLEVVSPAGAHLDLHKARVLQLLL